MKNLLLLIIAGLLAVCEPCVVYAQASRGDLLFAEGQALQKKGQNKEAILKYQAAKVAYTTEEKKQLCDTQIELCKQASRAAVKKVQTPSKETKVETKDFINSQIKLLTLSDKKGNVDVAINASDSTWTFEIPKGLEGEEVFVSGQKTSDLKHLTISAIANESTLDRHQSVFVKVKNLIDTIDIVQSGKPVTLRTSESILKFKAKGGKEKIDIITNSDSLIATNNNECWYLVSKPEWVEFSVEAEKQENVATATLKKVQFWKKEVKLADDEKSSKVVFFVNAMQKTDPEYKSGRRGEIIIASQSARQTIVVIQQ